MLPPRNFRILSATEQTFQVCRHYSVKMGQAKRPTCPNCGAYLILALPPGGDGPRTFQCFECGGPDLVKTEKVAMGWLKGELRPPK